VPAQLNAAPVFTAGVRPKGRAAGPRTRCPADVPAALAWYERALPGAVRQRLDTPEALDDLDVGAVML
jgi:hypothetical protein